MTIFLSTLAVTFAAFCVWLTVRIVNRRKKPGKAFWVTGGMAVVALYVLTAPVSEVLVLHIVFRGWLGVDHRDSVIAVIRAFYSPVHWLELYGPWPIRSVLDWYYGLWLGGFSI